ncbi:hypothetical protein [Acaryochloris marina]|uniref:Uncharacterized protein n=1 Tax=Acaryochloris marina (strain MBIC 11017) TaxID=329726 RepID=B0BZ33_ACAM1|nr:hypothetical protein [Acaryochloris marina]ABW28333.1 conserved hypothetical protein [Acaryochloris marina MBIC11017]BDM77356.1 hypothetical protein AM10699_02300 [Acaryochloris marina MBIC10699]
MFLDELTPLFQEFVSKPVAFMGGFASGLFRLDLNDDPVKSWLDQKRRPHDDSDPTDNPPQSNSGGPQSITIE